MAVIPIAIGQASVLFTFYPPLTASPWFYIGLVLVVVGSWVWCVLMLVAMRAWKRENPGRPVPLAMFATVANAVMWLWTTVGVAVELVFQVIPAALGLVADHRRRAGAHAVLLDAACDRLFLADPGLHRLLHHGAARGRRPALQRHHGAAHLHPVSDLQPAGRHASSADGSRARQRHQVHSGAADGFRLGADAADDLHDHRFARDRRPAARRRGVFGWIAALPWERPMVLATGLGFVMLGFGGFGGIINMGYGMNAMVHNTSWVTAHFHLIFGGSVVIMYFAIAYEIWPRLTGREHASLAPLRLQLWLWFIGMMVMTLPWHWLGLQGQWRRVANFNYADPIIAGWGPWVVVSLGGGLVLLVSALLFVRNLAVLHRGPRWRVAAAALCARGASAAARARCAERIRPVECAGARADAARLRLSDRAVPDRAVARRDRAPGAIGMRMTTEPHLPSRMCSTSHGGSGRASP